MVQCTRRHELTIILLMYMLDYLKKKQKKQNTFPKKKKKDKQVKLYTYNNRQLIIAQQLHQAIDYTSLDDHLDAVIGAVCQV